MLGGDGAIPLAVGALDEISAVPIEGACCGRGSGL